MSNEESVAGINVRELRDENKRLEKALRLCAAGCDIAIQDQQARIQQLEEENARLSSVNAYLDKENDGFRLKNETFRLRIAQLEEALREVDKLLGRCIRLIKGRGR